MSGRLKLCNVWWDEQAGEVVVGVPQHDDADDKIVARIPAEADPS